VIAVAGVGWAACFNLPAMPPSSAAVPSAAQHGAEADASATEKSASAAAADCPNDLKANKDHCGKCNHRCQGGQCKEGFCQPVLVASVPQEPRSLAVDEKHIYYTATQKKGKNYEQSVYKLGKQGGTPVLLASGRSGVASLLADGASAYWVTAGKKVMRVPADGGAPTVVATMGGTVESMKMHAGSLFMCTSGKETFGVYVLAATGGKARKLATADCRSLAVDTSGVYFTNGTDVKRMPLSGGDASKITIAADVPESVYGISVMAVTASSVVLTHTLDWGSIRFELPAAVPKGGGEPIGPDGKVVSVDLAADDREMFWIGDTGGGTVLERCAADGKECEQADLTAGYPQTTGLALDSASIYFAAGKSIVKVAR
jgi:hypothetical protein